MCYILLLATGLLRYFADKGNMPKFTKGHYSCNIFQYFIITNQFTKFQVSSSNSFSDILLTR